MEKKLMQKLKGRSSYPFENIATAIAFSPTSKYVLGESVRLCKAFSATLILIHVGHKTVEKEEKMNQLIQELKVNELNYKIIWEKGDPVEVILKVCKENIVDLLIAGALKKESFWNFYKGSVARKLCRNAKCSLLLLTNPNIRGTRFENMIVNGVSHEKTEETVKTALYFAKGLSAKGIEVIEEVNDSEVKTVVEDDNSCLEAKKERDRIEVEEKRKFNEFLQDLDNGNVLLKYKCLFGKPGYTIGHYSEAKKTDLLVMNSPSSKLGLLDRVFTHDLEYILGEMPTNLMIVHSRIKSNTINGE